MGRILSFLVDASTFKLLLVAFTSRILLAAWVIGWGLALEDYDESTRLNDVDLRLPEVRHGTRPAPEFPMLWHWDAVHFRHIADYGYTHESNFAFFPLTPLLIRAFERLVPQAPFVAFTVMQFILYSASVVALRSLLKLTIRERLDALLSAASTAPHYESSMVKRRHERAVLGVALFMYIASPAATFTVVSYTEPFYVALTLAGLLQLHVKNRPLVSAICMGCATGARSNGILLAPYLIQDGVRKLRASKSRGIAGFFDFLGDSFMRLFSAVLAVVPYLAFNKIAFTHFCSVEVERPEVEELQAKIVELAPQYIPAELYPDNVAALCNAILDGAASLESVSRINETQYECPNNWPSMYADLQRRHWGVGWMTYYKFHNLHNFAIAAPLFIACFIAVVTCFYRAGWSPLRPHRWILKLVFDSPQTCWLLAMLVISATRMHVQVVTRFVFVCPAFYLALAATAVHSSKFWKFLLTYVAVYAVLSPILFANFYPWT